MTKRDKIYTYIDSVYSEGEGWRKHNPKKDFNPFPMYEIAYQVIDENGDVHQIGTEDFSHERYRMLSHEMYEVRTLNGRINRAGGKMTDLECVAYYIGGNTKAMIRRLRKRYGSDAIIRKAG